MHRIREWRIRDDILSLSDHLYYVSEVSILDHARFINSRPRWNFKKADTDLFNASIEWSCSMVPPGEDFFLNADPTALRRFPGSVGDVPSPRYTGGMTRSLS